MHYVRERKEGTIVAEKKERSGSIKAKLFYQHLSFIVFFVSGIGKWPMSFIIDENDLVI